MTSLIMPRIEGRVTGVMSFRVYLLAVGSSASAMSAPVSSDTRCRQFT